MAAGIVSLCVALLCIAVHGSPYRSLPARFETGKDILRGQNAVHGVLATWHAAAAADAILCMLDFIFQLAELVRVLATEMDAVKVDTTLAPWLSGVSLVVIVMKAVILLVNAVLISWI